MLQVTRPTLTPKLSRQAAPAQLPGAQRSQKGRDAFQPVTFSAEKRMFIFDDKAEENYQKLMGLTGLSDVQLQEFMLSLANTFVQACMRGEEPGLLIGDDEARPIRHPIFQRLIENARALKKITGALPPTDSLPPEGSDS